MVTLWQTVYNCIPQFSLSGIKNEVVTNELKLVLPAITVQDCLSFNSFRQSERQLIFHSKKPQSGCQCFPHKLEPSNRVKDWLNPNKTFKISNGACSLMMREISCNQIAFNSMLQPDSNQCAFPQFIQYNMVVSLKIYEERGRACSLVQNPLCLWGRQNYLKIISHLCT